MHIRALTAADYPQVAAIYLQGIATRNATFHKEAYEWLVWDAGHLSSCRIAAFEDDGQMLGSAALSPVSSRCVYVGVAEVGIYIATQAQGKGLGKILLQQLIHDSEAEGIWTLQSGVFPENTASIPARKLRLPAGRLPRTHRLHGRRVARHDSSRTTQ